MGRRDEKWSGPAEMVAISARRRLDGCAPRADMFLRSTSAVVRHSRLDGETEQQMIWTAMRGLSRYLWLLWS